MTPTRTMLAFVRWLMAVPRGAVADAALQKRLTRIEAYLLSRTTRTGG